MKMEIRLYTGFKKYAPGSEHVFDMSVASGATVGDVFKALDIPADMPAVILLNGRRAEGDTRIRPKSSLVVFSPVSGG